MRRIRIVALPAAALLTAALVQTPASAAPAYTTVTVQRSFGTDHDGDCSSTPPVAPPSSTVPVPVNGPAVSSTVTGSQAWKSNADATDTATVAISATGSARATSTGTTPKSVEIAVTGRSSLSTSHPRGFACSLSGWVELANEFEFTLTRPLLATLSYDVAGSVYSEAQIRDQGGDPRATIESFGIDGQGSTTVYLRPGKYTGYLEGDMYLMKGIRPVRTAGSGHARITFTVPGSVAVSPKGKARKQVVLPAARDCSAHIATPRLTTKAKKLRKAKKIVFTVNGKKAASLKGKKLKKGRAIPFGLADKTTAELGVTVTLKNGKKVTASATYNACS